MDIFISQHILIENYVLINHEDKFLKKLIRILGLLLTKLMKDLYMVLMEIYLIESQMDSHI